MDMATFLNPLLYSSHLATSLTCTSWSLPGHALKKLPFLWTSPDRPTVLWQTAFWRTPGGRRVVVLPPSRPSFPRQRLSPGNYTCLPQQAGTVRAPLFVPFLLATLAAHPGQTTSAMSWQGTGRLLDKTTSRTAPAFHTPILSPIDHPGVKALCPFFPGERKNQADACLGPPLGADEDAGLHPSLSNPSWYSIQILSLFLTNLTPMFLCPGLTGRTRRRACPWRRRPRRGASPQPRRQPGLCCVLGQPRRAFKRRWAPPSSPRPPHGEPFSDTVVSDRTQLGKNRAYVGYPVARIVKQSLVFFF
jgi:hypothetical protein